MESVWSRRAFLSTVPLLAAAADRNPSAPSEIRRFRDPATEFDLLRLTDPTQAAAILPRAPLRSLSGRHNSLLYCSDRSGSMQAWRMDLKSGESRQWTNARALDPQALSLTADDKSVIYRDEDSIVVLGSKPKTVYSSESGWEPAPGFAISDDGSMAAVGEKRSGRFRLRVVSLRTGAANTIFEAGEPVQYIRFRPKRAQVLYNHAGTLTLASYGGRGSHTLRIAEGTAGDALWSSDGDALHYLSIPPEPGRLIRLRELLPDTNEDKTIGPTTQFVSFARNADSSVFAGVSGSKAAPYVLLLVRAAHRELTVAEHRASSPDRAVVAFSPNSQRLFIGSDREGKPAIYEIALERFVEKTEMSARTEFTQDSRRRS